MSDECDRVRIMSAHLLGLAIVSELKTQVDNTESLSRLEQARNHLTEPHHKADFTGSGSNISKALTIASNVAVRNGYSNLLELTDDFCYTNGKPFVAKVTHPELSYPVFSITDEWRDGGAELSESRIQKRFDWKGVEYNQDEIELAFMMPESLTPDEVIKQYLPEGDSV